MVTISAQVVIGTLLGVVGIIFATPLTARFMVLVQRLSSACAGEAAHRTFAAGTLQGVSAFLSVRCHDSACRAPAHTLQNDYP